jgi:hypothetical protein
LWRGDYNGVMRNEERIERSTHDATERLEAAGGAASHFAETARTLVAMGGMATSISSSAHVEPAEADAIRQFLPDLAARYGIAARIEERGTMLTVTFERLR